MIPVTKTFLPPKREYQKYLKQIWDSAWVTNNGPLVKEFEQKMKDYLGVKHFFFVNNGTIALQIALKALEIPRDSEVITTPFSYVATTSSIVWEGYKPVFVDIDPDTLTINPKLIEQAITKKTKAILPTHVFGNPCHIEEIEKIAKKHNLQVIYDAAHTFGAKYKGKHIASYGDISTLSFHATKLFHTGEGGGIVTDNDKLAHKISYMRNFGHRTEYDYWGLGINGKSSELNAAMGLAVFPYLNKIIESRKKASKIYDNLLLNDKSHFEKPTALAETTPNYSYYPILFPNEKMLLTAIQKLNKHYIFPRKYFYPSLNTIKDYEQKKLTVSEDISHKILCLPLYYKQNYEDINNICLIIKSSYIK